MEGRKFAVSDGNKQAEAKMPVTTSARAPLGLFEFVFIRVDSWLGCHSIFNPI